jgi:predicted  nucleic acid-binding Zn-ribbon protein
MLERQRQRLDETILRRVDEIEAAGKAVELAKAAVDEAERALRIVQKRFEKASARIDEGMQKHEPKRAKLVKKLKPDALRRYDELRKRNHNLAAVRIENGACGGCRMKVGGALLRRVLANEQYVYCESCNRFLFPAIEEPTPVVPPPVRKTPAPRVARKKPVVAAPPAEPERVESTGV